MGNAALRRAPKNTQPTTIAAAASDSGEGEEGTTPTSMSAGAAPWRALVEKSLARNRALPNARYIQIATVRPDGRPANRTVVFR